jgi:hypothetical protein
MISGKKRAIVKKSIAKKKKTPPTAQQLAQRKQKQSVRRLFETLGFNRVKVDGLEFKFRTRTGELDDVFLYKNVIVIAEYTVGEAASAHVSKKSMLSA